MKFIFDQTRPDRKTVLGHVHGVSFSGKRKDAFPSGHALHMGALASAAGTLPPGPRRVTRVLAVSISLTRVPGPEWRPGTSPTGARAKKIKAGSAVSRTGLKIFRS